jgi:transposase
MHRYARRDDQWDRIEKLLPGKAGDRGRTARDNRLFVEAVLYRYRAGVPWRDLPERFGDLPSTVCREVGWNGGRQAYRTARSEQRAWDCAMRPELVKRSFDDQLCQLIARKLQQK